MRDSLLTDPHSFVADRRLFPNDRRLLLNDRRLLPNDRRLFLNDRRLFLNDRRLLLNDRRLFSKDRRLLLADDVCETRPNHHYVEAAMVCEKQPASFALSVKVRRGRFSREKKDSEPFSKPSRSVVAAEVTRRMLSDFAPSASSRQRLHRDFEIASGLDGREKNVPRPVNRAFAPSLCSLSSVAANSGIRAQFVGRSEFAGDTP